MGDTALTAACVRAATAGAAAAVGATAAPGAAALAATYTATQAANAGMVEYCASSCRKVIFTFIWL
ncbi:MAG: hypothetical protein JWO52_5085 [Gammaproteobacteria bacterium]|nr:hypothetical protein [Gammaproteobacteria bacterium]